MKKYLIALGVVLVIAGYSMSKYNSMVSLKNETGVAWAQVENQLQRRFDLVPQLVESVSQVFKQEGEKNVYLELAKTRDSYAGAKTVDEKMVVAQNFNSGLSRLLAITENYPQLRASENVKDLQAQIEGTENRLAVERGRYNEAVGRYNGHIVTFPNKILAGIFGFITMNTFDAQAGADNRPDIKNLFNN